MNNEKLEMKFLKLVDNCGEFADSNINNEESKKIVVREIQKYYKLLSNQTPEIINKTYKLLINKTGRERNCSLRSIKTIDIICKRLFIAEIWTRETIYTDYALESEKLNQELKDLVFDSLSRKELLNKTKLYEYLMEMVDDSYANLRSIMYRINKIIEEY